MPTQENNGRLNWSEQLQLASLSLMNKYRIYTWDFKLYLANLTLHLSKISTHLAWGFPLIALSWIGFIVQKKALFI